MRASISLGRIAGIRVGINASVFLIVAIVVFGLATGSLPDAYPDRSIVAYIAAAIVAAVLFFASLLAHELAHSLVARRNGIEVDSIVLWLLGGVAQLRGEAEDPWSRLPDRYRRSAAPASCSASCSVPRPQGSEGWASPDCRSAC